MTTRWNDLVALAREIEQARRDGKTIDPRKARRLARAVLEVEHAPRSGGGGGARRAADQPGPPASWIR